MENPGSVICEAKPRKKFDVLKIVKFQQLSFSAAVQIAAETYVINQSFDGSGKDLNGVDSIGLMVYEGTETLKWTKSYTNGPDQGQGTVGNFVPWTSTFSPD